MGKAWDKRGEPQALQKPRVSPVHGRLGSTLLCSQPGVPLTPPMHTCPSERVSVLLRHRMERAVNRTIMQVLSPEQTQRGGPSSEASRQQSGG